MSVPGVAASNSYGGYEKTTRSPVRVGLAMSDVLFGPLGMNRASAFVNVRSMTFHPSGWPSWVQSFGSVRPWNAARICATVVSSWAVATCVNPPPAGSRPWRLR